MTPIALALMRLLFQIARSRQPAGAVDVWGIFKAWGSQRGIPIARVGIPIARVEHHRTSLHFKGELEALGQQRVGLEDMLKDMKWKDNILPKLMTTSGSYEELFKRELSKFDPICVEVAKNVDAQERLLHQIKVQNDAFAAAFNLEEYKATREKAYEQVNAAIAKYREIRENINEGLKFYVTL